MERPTKCRCQMMQLTGPISIAQPKVMEVRMISNICPEAEYKRAANK